MKNPFLSLKYPNFRIYWIGMNLSLIGSWMQSIALPWLVLSITADAFKVSLVAAAQFLPALLFTPFSGVLLDKFDRKKILLLAQIGMMIIASIFSFMVFCEIYSFEKILSLAFVNGIFRSLDSPSRQSMVKDLVGEPQNISNAIALNSMSFNVTRIAGPALAGLVMALWGVGFCFLFNAISFLGIIISLFFVKISPSSLNAAAAKPGVFSSIKAGISYISHKRTLSKLLLTVLVISTLVPNYNVTISALVKLSLGADERSFGYLMSALGAGAFFGALFVAVFGRLSVRRIYLCASLLGLSLALIGAVSSFIWASAWLAATGFLFVATNSSINSAVQMHVSNEFRGRVMSIYALFFIGSTPFGALLSGFLVNCFGARAALAICGAASISALFCIFYKFKKAHSPLR
nr:MFS transporter [uncultured Campylobacter sp.]